MFIIGPGGTAGTPFDAAFPKAVETDVALSVAQAEAWKVMLSILHQSWEVLILEELPRQRRDGPSPISDKFLRRVSGISPNGKEWERQLWDHYTRTGNECFRAGHFVGALETHRRSLEIARVKAAESPNDPEWAIRLKVSYDSMGDSLLAWGDTRGALAAYQHGFDIVEAVSSNADNSADDDPNRGPGLAERVQSLQYESHLKLANAWLERGDVVLAQQSYAFVWSALSSLETKAALESESLARQSKGLHEDVRTLIGLGDVCVAQGRTDEAFEHYKNALKCTEKWKAVVRSMGQGAFSDHQVPLQRCLVEANHKLGDCRFHRDLPLGASGEYEFAIKAAAQLVAQANRHRYGEEEGERFDLQHDLWLTNIKLGDAFVRRGKIKEGRARYHDARANMLTLLQSDPASLRWLQCLWVVHDRLAHALSVESKQFMGRKDVEASAEAEACRLLGEAVGQYRICLKIARKMAAIDPGSGLGQRRVELSCVKISQHLPEGEQEPFSLKALVIARRLVEIDPGNIRQIWNFAKLYFDMMQKGQRKVVGFGIPQAVVERCRLAVENNGSPDFWYAHDGLRIADTILNSANAA